MTGWRLDSSGTAGAKVFGSRKRFAIFALVSVLFVGTHYGWCAETAQGAKPPQAAAQAKTAVGPLVVGGEKDTVKLTFAAKGDVVHHLSVSEAPPGAVVRVENARFDSLPPKVVIGDGVVDTVEFSAMGEDAVISIKLLKVQPVGAKVSTDGLVVLIGKGAATAATAQVASVPQPSAQEAARPAFAVDFSEDRLKLTFGLAPSRIDSFPLSDGLRLVVDMKGVTVPGGQYVTDFPEGPLAKVALRQNGDSVRCVVEAKTYGRLEGYKIDKAEDGLIVRLAPRSPAKEVAVAKAEKPRELVALPVVKAPEPTPAEPKPVEVAKAPEPKPVEVAKTPEVKSAEAAKAPEPKPVDVAKVAEAKPAEVAKAPEVKPVEVAKAPEVKPVEVAQAPAVTPAEVKPAAKAQAKPLPVKGGGQITEVGFRQDGEKSVIDLAISKPAAYEVVESGEKRVVFEVRDTSLSEKYQKALDTTDFKGPVSLVAAYRRGPHTRLVIDLKRPAPFKVETLGTGLSMVFEGGEAGVPQAAQPVEKERIVLVTPEGGKVEEAPTKAAAAAPAEASGKAAPARTGYTGQRISMDFVEADIRNILRIIGEVAGVNMVAGSEVTGKMTIRLVDIPWDQALDVILKAKGLDKEVEGNVMRIVAAEKLASERSARAAADLTDVKTKEDITPLVSDIIPVSYAEAKDILENIRVVLSKRGSATIDARTNMILLRDLPDNIKVAREMVARLDTPTPQVLIEARIVEVSSNVAKDLGIQWGGAFSADPSKGNAPSSGFPNTIGIRGDTGLSNYAVNLPAPVASGGSSGAAMAMSLGSINDILRLDLRLAALETTGKARLVSSPRVTTLDNKPAEISQGTQIPVSTATQEKIANQLVDYLLKLSVTPHVTSDNSILLKIDIRKDDLARESIAASGASAPPKSTRAATTQVLVRDGETTVIGGIITDNDTFNESGIPWFKDIPFIGWLFRSKSNKVDKTELIIFITPRIIHLDMARNQ